MYMCNCMDTSTDGKARYDSVGEKKKRPKANLLHLGRIWIVFERYLTHMHPNTQIYTPTHMHTTPNTHMYAHAMETRQPKRRREGGGLLAGDNKTGYRRFTCMWDENSNPGVREMTTITEMQGAFAAEFVLFGVCEWSKRIPVHVNVYMYQCLFNNPILQHKYK